MINGIESRKFSLEERILLVLQPKIIVFLLKPFYTATELAFPGEIFQNASAIGTTRTGDTAAGPPSHARSRADIIGDRPNPICSISVNENESGVMVAKKTRITNAPKANARSESRFVSSNGCRSRRVFQR